MRIGVGRLVESLLGETGRLTDSRLVAEDGGVTARSIMSRPHLPRVFAGGLPTMERLHARSLSSRRFHQLRSAPRSGHPGDHEFSQTGEFSNLSPERRLPRPAGQAASRSAAAGWASMGRAGVVTCQTSTTWMKRAISRRAKRSSRLGTARPSAPRPELPPAHAPQGM